MTGTNPTRLIVRRLTRTLWVPAVAYAAIVVVAAFVSDAATGAFGEVRSSVAQYPILNSPKYFLMVFGILAATTQLPIFVAHGITRRDFVRGAAVFFAALAALYAALQIAVLGTEYAVCAALGVLDRFTQAHPVATPGAAGRLFLECLMIGLANLVGGALIGTGYYRFGPWLGTVLIAPAYLPALVAETAFNSRSLGVGVGVNRGLGLEVAALPVAVLISAVVVAAGWWVCSRLTRSVALKRITS